MSNGKKNKKAPVWEDRTGYARGAERIPRTWQLEDGGLTLVVTRHRHHEPDVWLLECLPWFSGTVISRGTAEEAQIAAVAAVMEKLENAVDALSKARGTA